MMRQNESPKCRRWIGIVLNIVLWGTLVMGTIGAAPSLLRDAGWQAVASCVAWSFCMAVAAIDVLWLSVKTKKPVIGAVISLAAFLLMLLAPPVVAAFAYGQDAAGGAAYLAILTGWGTICIGALVGSRKLENDNRKFALFQARFKEAPIGNWRGIRFTRERIEQGCRIVFDLEGNGQFRLWDTAEAESTANPVPFHWRPAGEKRIEVTLADGQTSKQLEFCVPLYGENSAKLILSVPGIETRDEAAYDIGVDQADEAHWPRSVLFEYLGEPT